MAGRVTVAWLGVEEESKERRRSGDEREGPGRLPHNPDSAAPNGKAAHAGSMLHGLNPIGLWGFLSLRETFSLAPLALKYKSIPRHEKGKKSPLQ